MNKDKTVKLNRKCTKYTSNLACTCGNCEFKPEPWSKTMTNEQLAIADEAMNGKKPMPPNTKKCCDGECNHDACCGKITENCKNPLGHYPSPTPAVEDWEIEFEKEFRREDGLLDIGKYDDEIIKDFIRSLREADRKRIVAKLEKEKVSTPYNQGKFSDGHDDGIQKAINFITNLK